MVYQYYIVEIQQYENGEYGHIVHYAWDTDATKARLNAESKYYQVLSAAAVSELPQHSAIMFNAEGYPIMNQCYRHSGPVTPDVSPEPEEAAE